MYEERLLLDQNKNSSVFARPNNPDLVANGGYDQADNQCIRYGYDQASIKYGRCGYCCQADNQYGGMDIIKLIINIVDMDVTIAMMISMVNMGVVKWILKSMGSIDTSVVI